MKKLIILISLIILSNLIIAQNNSKKADSLYFEKKIKEISEISKSNLERARQTNDSLERELLFYHVKEDYYSSALDDQSNRFVLIVTILIAAVGLLSFASIKMEVNRIKETTNQQLRDQMNEFEKYKTQLKELEIDITLTSANSFTAIARDFESKKDYFNAFQAYTWAFQRHARGAVLKEPITDSEEKKEKYKTTITNLKGAIRVFNEIKQDENLKSKVKDKSKELFAYIDYLNKVKYAPVLDLAAELRTELNNYIK